MAFDFLIDVPHITFTIEAGVDVYFLFMVSLALVFLVRSFTVLYGEGFDLGFGFLIEGVYSQGFLGDDFDRIARRIAGNDKVGEREEAKTLIGVVIIEAIARYDEVLIAFEDDRAVALLFDIR
jgi:hypothetical protein